MSETPDVPLVLTRFSKRLRKAREARGLSLSVVAQTVGTSQQYLSLVEQGERDPDFSLVAKLVVFFDLDLVAIVYGQKFEGVEAGVTTCATDPLTDRVAGATSAA